MNNTTCKDRIDTHLKYREDDFLKFMNNNDNDEIDSEFHNYGLSFTFEKATRKQGPHYKYLLSWGGPSDEIRFYDCGIIEYWFMDWGDGAFIDITKKEWAIWLKDFFCEIGSIKEDKRIEYGT